MNPANSQNQPSVQWLTKSNVLMFFLSMVLSFFAMVLLIPPPQRAFDHAIAYSEVRRLAKFIAEVETEFSKKDTPNLDQRLALYADWLMFSTNSKLDETRYTPELQQLLDRLGKRPEGDPWGSGYQVASQPDGIGVFSLGRNRISSKKNPGEDADDLNSWNENSGALYAAEVFNEGIQKILALAALMTVPLFIVLRRTFRHLGLIKQDRL